MYILNFINSIVEYFYIDQTFVILQSYSKHLLIFYKYLFVKLNLFNGVLNNFSIYKIKIVSLIYSTRILNLKVGFIIFNMYNEFLQRNILPKITLRITCIFMYITISRFF